MSLVRRVGMQILFGEGEMAPVRTTLQSLPFGRLLIIGIHRLGHELSDERTARVAAAATAFHLTFILMTAFMVGEVWLAWLYVLCGKNHRGFWLRATLGGP